MRAICLVGLLSVASVAARAEVDGATALIPAASVSELRHALGEADSADSTVARRRVCKRVIRRGRSILESHPHAKNRFAVLAALFDAQQALLSIDDSQRNREDLLSTCRALAEAPPEHAALRLPADVMLTQIAIARAGAATNEVTAAISGLVRRYEGTPMQADSLMTASMMAMNSGSADLLKSCREILSERFSHLPAVKAFQRERFGKAGRALVFGGNYTRADGSALRFPIDRLGHLYLVCFWSEEADYLDGRLLEIKAVQDMYPGRFEVYSFNLDERPDCGQGRLRRLGLDWIPVRLPGGVKSDAYLAYGHMTPTPFAFLAVNERGYVRGKSNRATMPSVQQEVEAILSSRHIVSRDPSYFALMQSLLIGDFLVASPAAPPPTAGLPEATLAAINDCFPAPEVRIRLNKRDALANYRRADALCRVAIGDHPHAPDLFVARNSRIIALMGMWNLTGEAKHLDQALEAASVSLDTELPRGAEIVPRFCVARTRIRESREQAEAIVDAFVETCGGERAPGLVHAAAVILALDGDSRESYLKYRSIVIDRFAEDQRTWPVADFFLARSSAASLFDASGVYGAAHVHGGWKLDDVAPRLFRAEFTTLKGKTIRFPADTQAKHNLIVFAEPPVGAEDAALLREVLAGLQQAVDEHAHSEIRLLAAFLTEDANSVSSLVDRNGWTFDVACVPGGTNSLMAVRMGAYAADRLPRTYVVAPDGSIEAIYDGLAVSRDYHGNAQERDRHRKLYIFRSIKLIIRAYDVACGRRALEAKDYAEAAKRLAVSFPGRPVNAYNRSARYSLRANLALENWEAALRDVDTVLKDPGWRHPNWRSRDGRTREEILQKLGKSD